MKRLYTLLLFFCWISAVTGQTVYTTLQKGQVSDPAIWSTDGGLTGCNCTPTTELPTLSAWNRGNMVIRHEVTLQKNAVIIGSLLVVTVEQGGSLQGNYKLEVRGGVLNNFGTVQVAELEVYNSGFLNSTSLLVVSPGDLINAYQGRMDLAGFVQVSAGNVYNEGWINVKTNAQMVVEGLFDNQNFLNIEPGGCVNITGALVNQLEVNLVNGPGTAYISSGGDISNLGFWHTDVNWCAAGTGSGLTHPANCTSCGPLPVELAYFKGWAAGEVVHLEWETVSATQHRAFSLHRSQDGQTFSPFWEEVTPIPSTGGKFQAEDAFPLGNQMWYRLYQTDQNGTTRLLATVEVSLSFEEKIQMQVYPNPFTTTLNFHFQSRSEGELTAQLLNSQGKVLFSETIVPSSSEMNGSLQPGKLPAGPYWLRIVQGNTRITRQINHF